MKQKLKDTLFRFKRSRFLLFTLGIIIGATVMYVYIEAPVHYNYLKKGYSFTNHISDKVTLVNEADVDSYSDPLISTDDDSTSSSLLGDIRAKIFTLESSNGKHVNCPANMYNGYGYRQNTREWKCYNTQKEVEDLVMAWLETQLETKTIPQALCYYNSGTASTDCPYYQKYLKL